MARSSVSTSWGVLLPWLVQHTLFLTPGILYCSAIGLSSFKSSSQPPVIELTGPANTGRRSSTPSHRLCHHPPEDTTMWQVCFAVFVIPTAIVTAMGLLHILVYGGESTDARG